MKMSSVKQPAQFIPGAGQYSYDEMLHGLHWLGATEEDILSGLSGLGALAQGYDQQYVAPRSVMDSIIRNAGELNAKQAILNRERMKAAKQDPNFAMKLSAAMKKTAIPGTNVAAGVRQQAMLAAKKAMQAKVEEAKARELLQQNDKRGAAATAVQALTSAREAIILSTRAEKTRLAVSLDSVAATLDAQAKYIDDTVGSEIHSSGPSKRTDMLRASAENLRAQAKKLRAQSAVVAQAPEVPPNAPTERRIAEVANKFNLRSVGRGTNANVIAVLADLSDSALAQVRDYEGAIMYYGNDAVGRIMCDMEFENYQNAVKGLQGAVHGMGYVDTLPVFAAADRALARGVAAAQAGFTNAVLPAFVGNSRGLRQMQAASVQLGGLGQHKALFLEDPAKAAARTAKWDEYCRVQYAGDAEQLQKCMNPGVGCDIFEPWEAVGKLCRGNTNIGGAIAQVGEAVVTGKVKLPDIGGSNKTPPANTLPPKTVPYSPQSVLDIKTAGIKTVAGQYSGGYAGGYAQPGSYRLSAPSNTMLYVGVGVGVVAVGLGVYWTMLRKPAA